MEKKLIFYLLRHGVSESFHPKKHGEDSDRSLTSLGRKHIRWAGKGFRDVERGFQHVLTSPYTRAIETTQAFLEGFEQTSEIAPVEFLYPHTSIPEFFRGFKRLKIKTGKVLIVSHNPFLKTLIRAFISPKIKAEIAVDTGTMTKLEIRKLSPGGAILDWQMNIEEMSSLAKPAA